MEKIQRVIIFVLDGVGAGAAPDADQYGDVGSNSLSNTAKAVGGLNLPNLEAYGFGRITPMKGVSAVDPANFESAPRSHFPPLGRRETSGSSHRQA